MWSLATIGRTQTKGSAPPTAQEMTEEMKKAEREGESIRRRRKKKKDGTVKEKKKKEGTVKEKKKTKEEKDSSAMVRKSLKAEKTQTT
jgi:hypothetical protein